MNKIVEIAHLSKKYGDFSAVKNLSLEIEEKEVFALIGPNGAGKSTTLRMLATLLKPTSGDAIIAEHSITKDADNVRQLISYLPEEAGAYKNLTGEQYLKFMAALYAENTAQAKEFYSFGSEISQLEKRLKDKVSTYSKGMTRKLLLARTVMVKPKLAILDEPTSGLDIVNAFEVRKIIKGLAAHGMSVLLSSHNMLEVAFLSDRVGFINHGELLEVGTPDQLLKDHKAANLEEVFMKITK